MAKTVTVTTKNLPQAPQKLRLVADLIRGMKAEEALDVLKLTNKKGSEIVAKTLKSGIANAQNVHQADIGSLRVTGISVDEAPFYKRYRFASRGRFAKIIKRRSHLNLELTVQE